MRKGIVEERKEEEKMALEKESVMGNKAGKGDEYYLFIENKMDQNK
jgi:hypothetical protein